MHGSIIHDLGSPDNSPPIQQDGTTRLYGGEYGWAPTFARTQPKEDIAGPERLQTF